MKWLKRYENFESESDWGLNPEEYEDLYELFREVIDSKNLDYEGALEYFNPKSNTFVSFLSDLEERCDWFDYRNMDNLFDELSVMINELDEDFIDLSDDELFDDHDYSDEEKKILLPIKFQDYLKTMPENGMGYQVVDVILKDGNVIEGAIVLNCDTLVVDSIYDINIKDISKISIIGDLED